MTRRRTSRFLPVLLAATCLVAFVAAHSEAQNIPAPPDVAAPPSDAEKSSSGLASKVLTAGTGTTHPRASDSVTVHYTGWTTDGTMFDSSVSRGEPSTFPLNGVIRGWTEGLQLMVVGEKRRFWIPENLAYGGRRPPLGMLVFDVELLAIR
jgi:FKBP-type peptidyl-prolyl cis-trans isomerase